jgi:heat shock protein HslJ
MPRDARPDDNSSKQNSAPVSLTGTDWILQDLAGTTALPNVKATLAFPEAGRAAGNASCNRFTGSAESFRRYHYVWNARFHAHGLRGQPASSQETEYPTALAAAKRFELKDSTLLIYAEGDDKPLRFTRTTPATPQSRGCSVRPRPRARDAISFRQTAR